MQESCADNRVWSTRSLSWDCCCCYAADIAAIQWKSGLVGNEDVSTSRLIQKKHLVAASWTVFGRSGHLRLQTTKDSGLHHELRFDGFPSGDYEKLKQALLEFYKISLERRPMDSSGVSYGKTDVEGRNLVFRRMMLEEADEEGEEFEPRVENEMMSMDLAEVSQCVLPGNNRHEIELQFPESDTLEAGTDQLGEFFLFIRSFVVFRLDVGDCIVNPTVGFVTMPYRMVSHSVRYPCGRHCACLLCYGVG